MIKWSIRYLFLWNLSLLNFGYCIPFSLLVFGFYNMFSTFSRFFILGLDPFSSCVMYSFFLTRMFNREVFAFLGCLVVVMLHQALRSEPLGLGLSIVRLRTVDSLDRLICKIDFIGPINSILISSSWKNPFSLLDKTICNSQVWVRILLHSNKFFGLIDTQVEEPIPESGVCHYVPNLIIIIFLNWTKFI